MMIEQVAEWLVRAADQFNRTQGREDGAMVARCLGSGLADLRELLYRRLHGDVEQTIGRDSMLVPVSEYKARLAASFEIDAYEIAESAEMAEQKSYVRAIDDDYLAWIAGMLWKGMTSDPTLLDRARTYLSMDADVRRRTVMDSLGRTLPESSRSPLVLFRLLPHAVRIVTAVAFRDHPTAQALRRDQAAILPAIVDCRECRGKLMECAEQCPACGNPLWKHQWLMSSE